MRSFAAMLSVMAAFVVLVPAARAQAEWKPETFTLANGMTAVVLPDHRAPVVTHMLWYRVGSADEVKGKSGLAHFLEHLMFKATDEIPAGEYMKIVSRNGGVLNAATHYDYTNYWFRVAKDRLPMMMRMEANRMTGLQLTDDQVTPELKVVMEERRQQVDSNPQVMLDEKIFQQMFAGHPYSVPVIGYMSELETMSRADAIDWYRTWYGPENVVLVVAGDITAAELKPVAEQAYGVIPRRGDLKTRSWPAVKPLAQSAEVTHSDPKVRQAVWSRNWLGVAMGDPDAEALQVGVQILAGGRTSRLYRELNERGKAVMSSGFSIEMEARGVINVSSQPAPGVSVEEIEAAVAALTDEFLRDGPTPQEVTRAKEVIAASSIFARDSQVSMANWYGQQLAAGVPLERIETWDERIRAVTAADVKRVMNKYLKGVNHVDATLLPGSR